MKINLKCFLKKNISKIKNVNLHVYEKTQIRPSVSSLTIENGHINLPLDVKKYDPTQLFLQIKETEANTTKSYLVPIASSIPDKNINEELDEVWEENEKEISAEEMGTWTKHKEKEMCNFKFEIYNSHLIPNVNKWQTNKIMEETGILETEGGIVNFNGLLFDSKKEKYCLETTHYHKKTDRKKWEFPTFDALIRHTLDRKEEKLIYKRGRCLNLFSLFSRHNYYHNLLDTYGKIPIVNESSARSLYDYDWYIIPALRFKIPRNYYAQLKINPQKMIHYNKATTENFQFDTVISPSINGYRKYSRFGAHDDIKKYFLSKQTTKHDRKIFLSREGAGRDVTNRKELYAFLDKHGFEIIISSKCRNLPQILNEAKIVLAAHGASLANLIFCKKGTHVIELLPEFYVAPYYMALANANQLQYTAVICEETCAKEPLKRNNQTLYSVRNFYVNLLQMDSILQQLCK